jgi:hypothetical protein
MEVLNVKIDVSGIHLLTVSGQVPGRPSLRSSKSISMSRVSTYRLKAAGSLVREVLKVNVDELGIHLPPRNSQEPDRQLSSVIKVTVHIFGVHLPSRTARRSLVTVGYQSHGLLFRHPLTTWKQPGAGSSVIIDY